MNREETRKAAEVMLHYANGGEVQMQNENGCMWHEYAIGCDPSWNWEHKTYRIKRKPIELKAFAVTDGKGLQILYCDDSESSARQHAKTHGLHFVELKGIYTCEDQ